MIEQIKELRIKIDGLSQLVKELKPRQWLVAVNSISHDLSMVEMMELLKNNSPLIPVEHTDGIKPLEQHEIAKCYDSLILAKAWLSKVLGELGTENPYGSGYKTKEDIVPTQDVLINKGDLLPTDESKETFKGWENMNYIEKVDWLRIEIETIVKNLLFIESTFTGHKTREFAIARTNSYNHLCEARFWLGFELQRIKEQQDGISTSNNK